MSQGFENKIKGIRQGEHVCLIYESIREQIAALVPYFRKGLELGEQCVYIADERSVEEVRAWLVSAGVDPVSEEGRGALVMLTKRETYLRSGAFDPEAMLAFLQDAEKAALTAGFTGLRAAGEETWALGPERGTERLIEFEALLNRILPGSHTLTICQFNRSRFPPHTIRHVLRTHPIAVIGAFVAVNPYYEPAEHVLGDAGPAEQVEWMLDQLRRIHEAEEEKLR